MRIGTSKLSVGYTTYVPRAVREALSLREGDEIEWHVEKQRIVVKKAGAGSR